METPIAGNFHNEKNKGWDNCKQLITRRLVYDLLLLSEQQSLEGVNAIDEKE